MEENKQPLTSWLPFTGSSDSFELSRFGGVEFTVLSGSKVDVRSQVGVSEHGVLLPHCAETFDCVDKLFIVHKLDGRRGEFVKLRF